MKTTFIYVLKDPRTDAIRYVGKSDNPVKRLSSHLGESRDAKCHRKAWIKSLKQLGLRPVVEVVDEVLETEWQALECAYIEYFREQGFDLTNNTAGGDGVSDPSPEVRERQRVCRLGKKLSVETRRKMSISQMGKHSGIKHAPETKIKITAAKLGAKTSRNKSGFVGVSWDSVNSQWKPHLCVSTKRIYLGRFDKLEDAIFARALAVDKYFSKTA